MTGSTRLEPVKASAQARIAGQRWCCEAAISEIAMHSSRQKPVQPNG
jgi:hypothetical protein